jgi:hypothetical protein
VAGGPWRAGQHRFGIFSVGTAVTMLTTMAPAGAGFGQSPRLNGLGGLFQRASMFDPCLEQIERDRGADHCDEQRRRERRGELRLGAQPGQRPGDSECQEETNGEHWLRGEPGLAEPFRVDHAGDRTQAAQQGQPGPRARSAPVTVTGAGDDRFELAAGVGGGTGKDLVRSACQAGDARYVRRMFGYGRADRCITQGGCGAG